MTSSFDVPVGTTLGIKIITTPRGFTASFEVEPPPGTPPASDAATVTVTDHAVEAMLERFEKRIIGTPVRKVWTALDKLGYTSNTPPKSTYIRMQYSGSADHGSVYLHSNSMTVGSRHGRWAMLHGGQDTAHKGARKFYFWYGQGDPAPNDAEKAIDVATALVKRLNGG